MKTTITCKILQRTNTQLRKLASRKFVLAVTALPLLALTFPRMMAQTASGAKVSAQSGAAAAATARQVVLGDLPQLTAPARRTPIAIPLRGPVFNPQAPGVPPSGITGNPSPPPAQPKTDTPGANKAFSGEDEACGFFIPSDHALATNSLSWCR